MGKGLIIAEKPSVANDLAKALGGFKKQKDFYESDQYVLSSAIGHLVELCLPNELDKKQGKWSFANLPIIPEKFQLKPIAKTEPRLKLLKRLLKRPDVDYLINACDAGREGELIFRYIIQLCHIDKPIQRLWLQSMTPTAIRHGFEHLREGKTLEPLAEAAICRSESDWLIGINGTRALTAFNSKEGGFHLTPVGRVQTPTLAMVVERDTRIKNHQPKDYWEVHASFQAQAGDYPARWFFEKFSPTQREKEEHARAERLWTQQEADTIVAECQGKTGQVEEETKPSSQQSPLLYDLTSLQREANSRFGFPARRCLQIAQALYEKHKAITYPRTDSRALPEDYLATTKQVLQSLRSTPLSPFAEKILEIHGVRPNKRIFNNTKISDHFAIIPTQQPPQKLTEEEQKIYDMIAKRFLAVFFPPAQWEITTRITRVQKHAFKTDGKVLKEPGWLEIYGKDPTSEDNNPSLVPIQKGEPVQTLTIEARQDQTKPPPRLNEATLLSSMESAGKFVEDEELRAAMGAKGLGTPATRAAIIEGLLKEEYLQRQGREISSTPKAAALLELLQAIDIRSLRSPEMTGEWEYKLKQIEQGNYTRKDFMTEINALTEKIVGKAKTFEESQIQSKPLGIHTSDGQPLVATLRDYQTEDGSLKFRKVIGGRLLEPHELGELLQKRFIGPLTGFRSRAGWPFVAALKLNEENKIEFVFDNAPVDSQGNKLDLSQETPIGQCPLDGGSVYEVMLSYACEHALKDEPTCKFKIGKTILEQTISREQAAKLLKEKKTDLLPRFISNKRGKRPFSAYLVLEKEGKVGFEFPPRTPK